MEVLYQAKYYNEKTTDFVLFLIIIVVLLIVSNKMISFIYNITEEVKSHYGWNTEHKIEKSDCVLLVRVLLIILLVIMIFSYITQLIPVMNYLYTGESLQIEGIVENYQSSWYNNCIVNESFTVGNCYFEVYRDDVQLTYTGGAITEDMYVMIDYYHDGSVNKILKIILVHE